MFSIAFIQAGSLTVITTPSRWVALDVASSLDRRQVSNVRIWRTIAGRQEMFAAA